MNEQHKQVVIRFIEAMGRSDAATAATCLNPDATTLAKGFGKFAGVRHYDVIVGTIAAFKELVPSGLSPTIYTVTAEGDRVAVEFEGKATLANGAQYNNQYCMVFTMRDGRIQHVNEYFCTLLADQVLYPLVAPKAELQAER
jgi:ketosteroid isomerase-like protein